METTIHLGEMRVDVVLKDIKNVHLSVYPPHGAVRIAAPSRMTLDLIRVYAISKLGWIKKQQQKLRAQERETTREFVGRESHFVWGKRYLLSLMEADAPPCVELRHKHLVLTTRPGADEHKRRHVMEDWYRTQVKLATEKLIAKWEPTLGVTVSGFYVQRMKTRWGSCNSRAQTIRLNTDLAKKPRDCLEYIVVHEMIHILEPTHNERFQHLMGHFMPDWEHRRQVLNRLPVRHEEWEY